MSFIEADARLPPTPSPHISADLLPTAPFPRAASLPIYNQQSHSIAASIQNFHYKHYYTGKIVNYTNASDNSVMDEVAHETWLGPSGPLHHHSASISPSLSEVTIQLPPLFQLQRLHVEFRQASRTHVDSNFKKEFHLPILFVRTSQGVTFFSGHWLHATCLLEEADRFTNGPGWRFAVV